VNIGFLGLGQMGEPLAANLVKAGHHLTVWNRTASKAAPLVKQGAKLANDIADAARNEIVCTMLADDSALQHILDDGLLDALPRNGIHLSFSSISVAMAEKLKKLHHDRGQHLVSAPVFGRPEAAAAAKLWVVVAGHPPVVAKIRPLLDAVSGNQVVDIGPDPVQANITKISGNFLIASALEAMGEAVALVRRYGVDPVQFIDFLTSTLFAAPVYKNYGAKIARNEYEPVGFRAPLGLKDMRQTIAAGEAKTIPLPMASLLHTQMLTAIAHYGVDADWSVIAKLAGDHGGTK